MKLFLTPTLKKDTVVEKRRVTGKNISEQLGVW